GADIAYGQGVGTILNDDGHQLPSLSINDVTMAEGDDGTTDMIFTVSLSEPSDEEVEVDFATADDTAEAGSDYDAVSGTRSCAPHQTSQAATVPIRGDTVPEPSESFVVNLFHAINATIARAQGRGTIADNDGNNDEPGAPIVGLAAPAYTNDMMPEVSV